MASGLTISASTQAQSSGPPRHSSDRQRDNPGPNDNRPSSPWPDESDTGTERRRRSSSDATPRPTPAPYPRHLGTATPHDTNYNVLGHAPSASDFFSSSKRLALFGGGDKGSVSQSRQPHSSTPSVAIPTALPSGRETTVEPTKIRSTGRGGVGNIRYATHARTESMNHEEVSSPLPPSSSSGTINANKVHTSPSKMTTGRTYDAKLVSREMHRLGNLAHLPASLTPALSVAATATSLTIPPQGSGSATNMAGSSPGDNPWGSLHVHVLPLFVGEPLRIPIEDLNSLVKKHLQLVLSQSPSKAMSTLEHDASELIASGMVTLNAKFVGVDDDKLVARVVEIWGFFWDQVLPYVEGVLLPLQTSPLLSSLYRTPQRHRTSSPTRQAAKTSMSSLHSHQLSTHIDVRTVALKSFRDHVILPLASRIFARLAMPNREDNFTDNAGYQQARLLQMLLVLNSSGGQLPPTFSLTDPIPKPAAGGAAVEHLLRAMMVPPPGPTPKNPRILSRPPSFLSGGKPGDRRGRIAVKPPKGKGMASGGGGDGDADDGGSDGAFGDGGETPRNGFVGANLDATREQFIEALRSPDVMEGPGPRTSVGGWGLGEGHEDSAKAMEEDDEDEALDWDEAQAVVERMVGMQPNEPPEMRRRAT